MNKGCLKLGLAALLGGMTLMAWAADPVAVLQQPQGKVFVSQGKVMAPVQQSLPLYAGNRVIVASGGRAEIVYPDGCMVALPENSLLAIQGADQCRLSQAQVRATGGFQNARIGQAGPFPSCEPNDLIADFDEPKGSVHVNGMTAKDNMDACRDDEIVTGEKSQVTVVFRSCEVEVGPRQQVRVGELREQCRAGVFLASGEDPNSEIALVKQVQGSVTIDTIAAKNDMGVKGSNQITTTSGDNNKVKVVFKGCKVVVGENQKVKVKDLVTQCKGGLWVDAGGTAGGAAGTVGTVGTAGTVGTGTLIVGGAFAASVGAAILAGGNERPVSPDGR